MFSLLGRLVTRRPIWVVLVWALFAGTAGAAALTGLGGTPLFEKLETAQPDVPGTDSEKVNDILFSAASGAATDLVLKRVPFDDQMKVAVLAQELGFATEDIGSIDGVDRIMHPFIHPEGPAADESMPFLGMDGESLLVRVELDSDLSRTAEKKAEEKVEHRLEQLGERLVAKRVAEDTSITSAGILMRTVNKQMEADLVKGELVALPVSLLVMVVVFGGFLAAGMPIIGALASIGGGLGSIWSLSYVMNLDSVVINVVTLLGLGLSIDYGLLVVSRFREELQKLVADPSLAPSNPGLHAQERDPLVVHAVERTVNTAGRTVVFSALTIAISVGGLIAMSPSLLKGMGTAGSLIVLIALLTAVTLIPAVLTLTGRRFLRKPILARIPVLGRIVGHLGGVAPEKGAFSALATWVQRYPWPVLVGCVAVLAVAATPVFGIHLRNSGVDVLPPGTPERTAFELVGEKFPAFSQADIWVIPAESAATETELAATSDELAGIEGIASVDPAVPLGSNGDHVLIGLRLDDGITPDSSRAVSIVKELRELDTTVPVWIGGQAAGQVDFGHALVKGLPIAGGMVFGATFVLLFLMTGSVLVPIKALLTNALSIAATLGITTWVFQEGHGAKLFGFESVGGLESYVVAVVVAFGFGLAMDYEVFLLSRIKEYYDTGMTNDQAVVRGLQGSGRIITSAALVIMVVFAGFASGELLAIKEAGFALALAVALDATIVRMLLVPATMTVLGELNWWAPRWLKPVAKRFSITH